MNAFINLQSIICAEPGNKGVKAIELPLAQQTGFGKITDYQNVISSIGDANTYIISADVFSYPGLIQAIQHYKPSSTLCSDLNALANNQNIPDGSYSLINIGINATSIFDITKSEGKMQVSTKRKMPTAPLQSYIGKEFISCLNIIADEAELAKTIFSYNSAAIFNDYITNPKFGIQNNPKFFKGCTLDFDGSSFAEPIKPVSVSKFVDSVTQSLVAFITRYCKSEKDIILKSSLTAYNAISSLLNTEYAIKAINEFEFLNAIMPASPIYSDYHAPVWIQTELQDLSFEFQMTPNSGKHPIKFEIRELADRLSATSYTIGKMQLTKYLAEVMQDCHNDLHLKIQTIDNNVYYKFIEQ